MKKVYEGTEDTTVVRENSFGIVQGPDKRVMRTVIYMSEFNPKRGAFEWYADQGGDYYAEGGLWFDDEGFVTDYDGVFSMPPLVAEWLRSQGRMTEADVEFWTKEGVLK